MLRPHGEDRHIFTANVHDFEKKVIQASHQQPVLVDLWAEWCSPCKVIAPILQQFIAEYEDEILLAKVEVDEGDGDILVKTLRFNLSECITKDTTCNDANRHIDFPVLVSFHP